MISVEEAKKLVSENISPLNVVCKPLHQASGFTLAEDINSLYDIPAFRQSSMDGYAIGLGDIGQALNLIGEMAAGNGNKLTLKSGEAIRIFTGAPVPEGADTVVMQEKTVKNGNHISVVDDKLFLGANIRGVGSEIRAGAMAMRKGSFLTPAALAYLAGIGTSAVKVFSVPRVAIILTGNELQEPGLPLAFGKVYESNSYSLSAALRNVRVTEIEILQAEDTLDKLTRVLDSALKNNDVVLLTGGVSVGDYDFVIKAAENCHVEQIFHKVKQKPGKPLYFGKQNEKVIFGLPGNPSSVLSCYYNYVLPALKKLSGMETAEMEIKGELTHGYSKPKGLTHFLKGNFADGKAIPLGAQESYRLSSFAQANCLIELDQEQEVFSAGEMVKVILIYF